jgi:broad specificity phosphatase PhoE
VQKSLKILALNDGEKVIMASIYLVRHGQAGFDKLDYDQLSDLGHQQGALVGQSLLARSVEAKLVVHGAMRRHRETLAGAQKVWHGYGPIIEEAGFNEFDSDDIIAAAHAELNIPGYRKQGIGSNKLVQKTVLGAYLMKQKNPKKAFQVLFSTSIDRWIRGENDDDYIESWQQFTQRCRQALFDTIEKANGRDVVVFSSGGPITAIIQHCLGLSDHYAFQFNWTLVNAGITQLLYNSQGKISLASCNEQEHLISSGKKFLTYR